MNEGSSARAALQLIKAGIRSVKVLRGGLEGWEKAGYATESVSLPDPHPPIVEVRSA
jgi:rhodanese-related sulfurtransferase